jgi:hypothetical protein
MSMKYDVWSMDLTTNYLTILEENMGYNYLDLDMLQYERISNSKLIRIKMGIPTSLKKKFLLPLYPAIPINMVVKKGYISYVMHKSL